MSVKLKKLIKNLTGIDVRGSKEIEISGLCSDSRCVSPGNLFIAKRGSTYDGTQCIPQALNAGAVAVLTDLYNPVLKNTAQLIAGDVVLAEALLAAEYYQQPDKSLMLIGITGTNGKTTASYMVKYFLDNLKGPCGLIGTIECLIGDDRYQTGLTTPDIITNYKLLKEMVRQGCSSAVMEVSSHALEQRRVENIAFDAVIFTNLSPEHLDYHATMENYAAAKRKLFHRIENKDSGFAIVNKDSEYAEYILSDSPLKVLTYGLHRSADLCASDLAADASGMRGFIQYKQKTVPFRMLHRGIHNVYNLLAAMAVPLIAGYSLEEICQLAAKLPPVRGRLEFVSNPLGLQIAVDFAHKEIALRSVLEAIRASCKGRVITVFGCGGNRDPYKRPKMAKISEELSDISIITSDNPRTEPPDQIIKEILAGFTSLERVIIEPDRHKAIAAAIDLAQPEDIILIAGKGHEEQQIFAHTTIPFNDKTVAYQLCCEKMQKVGIK